VTDTTFSSIDDYLKKITEFDIHAMQLSSGKFFCRKTELQLPKLVISSRYVSTSMQYHTTLKQDCFYIVIPRGNMNIAVNGYKTKLNQPLVFTFGQEIFACIPENSRNFHITIPTIELAKYFDEENIAQLKLATAQQNLGQQVFFLSENSQSHLCSLMEILLNRNQLLSYQAVLDAQETIIELLCKLLTLTSPLLKKNNTSQTTKLAIVKRALGHLHKNTAINISVPELADVSFCCLRSLEYAFKSVLSITPKKYLIKRRLHLINTALKTESNLSVSDIIKNFGVVNQGRFAQDYLKLYQEYPHQTRYRILQL